MVFRYFKKDSCDRCGICFVHCPVLGLPPADARKEIEALILGQTASSLAYQQCTTCYTCDLLCPLDANPYELILERWNQEQVDKGVSAIAKLVFPNEPINMWSSVRALMPDDELSLLNFWQKNIDKSGKTMVLTGFYTNLVPFVTMTSVIDKLNPYIAGFEGFWGCAGDAYKMGRFDDAETIGKMMQEKFRQLGIEKLYCLMGAEAMMLSDVLPNRFGIDFSFCQPEPLDYWMLDQLKSKKLKVQKKLNKIVTVHDNCMSKYMGGRSQEAIRETMDIIGCRVIEMEHNRQSALCCGWAATIPALHGDIAGKPIPTLLYLLDSLYRRLQEAEATGAEAMVVYCHACYLFLSLIKTLTSSRMEIYHSLELVQEAVDESPTRRNERRAWDMLAVVSNLLFRWSFFPEDRHRFEPHPATMEPVPPLNPWDQRRLKFFGKVVHSWAVQNAVARNLISLAVKSSIKGYRRLKSRKKQYI